MANKLIIQQKMLLNFSLGNYRLLNSLSSTLFSVGSYSQDLSYSLSHPRCMEAALLKAWFGGSCMSTEARRQRSKGVHVSRQLDNASGTRLRSLPSQSHQNSITMQLRRGKQPSFPVDEFENPREDSAYMSRNHPLSGKKNSTTEPSFLYKQSLREGDEQPKVKRNEPVSQSLSAKASTIVYTITRLSNVKEEVYSALDSWSAWDYKFPMVAVKKALKMLKDRQQWQRIIQVSKWMLSKGQGKTLGTYDLLIQALDEDGRLEEAEAVWNTLVLQNIESVPRMMYARMIAIYDKRGMLDKLFKVFKDMEDMSVKPDEGTVNRVSRAYEKLGLPEKKVQFLQKYSKTSTEAKSKGKGAFKGKAAKATSTERKVP